MGRPTLMFFVLNFIFILFSAPGGDAQQPGQPSTLEVSNIIDAMFRGYDKRIRPNYGGPPLEISVSMYILTLSAISEETLDFTMTCYFRQYWKDERLKFTAPPNLNRITLGPDMQNQIWQPDTFFANEKSTYFHETPTENSLTAISPNGDITMSKRYTITVACPMDLTNFPMDRQTCDLEFESFGFMMADLRYKWKSAVAVGISSEVSLPEFQVMDSRLKTAEVMLSTGNYSRLIYEIVFARSYGYYIIQIYLPSITIVIISWVSFWVNRNAIVGRVVIGVITLLIMTGLLTTTNAGLPKISYLKSIDLFVFTCFAMVLAALLEFVTISYLIKKLPVRRTHFNTPQGQAVQLNTLPTESYYIMSENVDGNADLTDDRSKRADIEDAMGEGKEIPMENPLIMDSDSRLQKTINYYIYRISPGQIDKYSRIIFPVFFIVFNFLYWIISLNKY